MTEPKTPHNPESAGCDALGGEGSHAGVLRQMLANTTPFRPDASSEDLVLEFATGQNRFPAFLSLYSRGEAALPAVREGLRNADCNVRRWSAIFIDNFADAASLLALVPLLNDPKADVRLWAVHSLSCQTCKSGPNPIDSVALLLGRIELDQSIRVRRQAVAMLAHHHRPDVRVLPLFRKIFLEEVDRRLRLHAEKGLKRYAESGLT